jgi:CheY-like chemotaxis protein/curved DNA-binding protein CbpA
VPSADPVHVLVVDDDRNVQRMLAEALVTRGFSVSVERDGEAALRAFERQNFDVVLLDVLLPVLNGYEVARRIKSTPRGEKTPVLLLSGVYKSKIHQAEALERHGAAAFVEKPFKLGQLFEKLQGVLGPRFPQTSSLIPRHASFDDAPRQAGRPAWRPRTAGASEDPQTSSLIPRIGSADPPAEPLADPRARAEASLVEATAPAETGETIERGDFSQRPFPELLAELHRRKATGALLLRREKVKKIVFFRSGIPESVKSNRLSECLGRVMVRERMISEADCEASLQRMKAEGRQQGTVLIEMGCISPHNLRYALELQLRLKLLDVFSWTSGDYQFNPQAQPPPETVRFEMSAAAIIYEGVRRAFDEARLASVLGDVASKYVHPASDPLFAGQDMALGDEEAGLLAQMDGTRTVRELRRKGPLSPLDTDRFLYALVAAQMVALRPEKRLVQPPAPRASSTSEERPWDEDEEVLELEDEVPPDEELHLRERLLGTLAAMRRMDFFELLGVPREVSADEVRRASVELLREYHVDAQAGPPETRGLAEQVQQLVREAHDTLLDPERRARYEEQLGHGGVRHEVGEVVGRMLEAESSFRRGEQMLASGEVAAAHRAFSEAVRLQPEEGEFLAMLGWTTHRRALDDKQAAAEALLLLEQAVQRSPALARAHLFKGHLHKALGQASEAQAEYEKAVECNPGCTEALRELSILGWASRGSPKKGPERL